MSIVTNTEFKVKVGITIGDFNGVGPEVIIKALSDNRMTQVCTPVIRNIEEINEKKINLLNCWDEEVNIELGKATANGGKYAFNALQTACKDLSDQKIDVLVTAPIDKKTMQQDGFRFPGHTEFLAQQFDTSDYLMMLVSDRFRIATVTGHVPLSEVASGLSKEKINNKIKVMNRSLKRDFGISKPKIAVLGLNPHSGDSGLIGNEEQDIIQPAIKQAFEDGVIVYGPYGADGFFGSGSFKEFDGVLAMYHDQGLIPFKALSFETGVNFTAGLPVVRTSPDHGTGYDIAGKGIASEESLRSAIYLACDIYHQRISFDKVNENPLKYSKLGGDR